MPDAAAAVVATVLLAVVSAHIPAGAGARPMDVPGYLLLVAAGASMGACRRWPRAAVVVTTAALACILARHYPNGPAWATGWIALAALSWRTSRRTALLGAAGLLAVLSVPAVWMRHGPFLMLVFAGWSAAAVFGGEALRNRRSYLTGLAERARFLERTREEETRRRVAEERLRIARDLHDSVAHRQPGHRAHPCQPGDGEAACPRPRPAGGLRLPVRPGTPAAVGRRYAAAPATARPRWPTVEQRTLTRTGSELGSDHDIVASRHRGGGTDQGLRRRHRGG
jgi:hypothetical protein